MTEPRPVALKDTLAVLNAMREHGAFEDYAICGAVAAFRYIEPAVTYDLDLSVQFSGSFAGIVTLEPVLGYLKHAGVKPEWRDEGVLIGRWPVQFLPADEPIDREALREAETIDFDGVPTRIWRIEHLMAKSLQVGRVKDQLRLSQFLESPFDRRLFCDILHRFDLAEQWQAYCGRFGLRNFCDPRQA